MVHGTCTLRCVNAAAHLESTYVFIYISLWVVVVGETLSFFIVNNVVMLLVLEFRIITESR